MSKTELIYHAKRYATLNNAVIFIAACITLAGIWSTVGTLQRNFSLQREVNDLDQQIEIAELEAATLALEQQYYRSDEYLELSARRYLGKVAPGESVIMLPRVDESTDSIARPPVYVEPSNFEQWRFFFFGS